MKIDTLTNILDLTAITVQIVATIIMFFNGPKNLPAGNFMSNAIDLEKPKKRESKIKIGFAVLSIGFIIQLGSLIIKIYYS